MRVLIDCYLHSYLNAARLRGGRWPIKLVGAASGVGQRVFLFQVRGWRRPIVPTLDCPRYPAPPPSIRVALQGCVGQRGGCGAHCPPEGWAGAVGRVVAGRTRMRRLGWRCRPSTFQVPYLPSNALTTEPGCFYGGPRAYEPPQHQDGAPSSPPGGG